MAERDALIKTDHPFIMKLHYSFQVGYSPFPFLSGFAGGVFCDVTMSWWKFLGPD